MDVEERTFEKFLRGMSSRELAAQFLREQQARAQAYSSFEQAFRDYIGYHQAKAHSHYHSPHSNCGHAHTEEEEMADQEAQRAFTLECAKTTVEFSRISARIRIIEDALKAHTLEDDTRARYYSSLIRTVQNHEQQKLQATVKMQTVHTQYVISRHNDIYDETYTAADRTYRQNMGKIVCSINEALDELACEVNYS